MKERLNNTLKLFVNGFVWIVVASFITGCLVSAVVEFLVKVLSLNAFVNTPVHARVAFYYNTLHNRWVRSVVGVMVCLTNLYNRAFSETYLVLVNESVVDPNNADGSQPHKSVVISSFRFGIEKQNPPSVRSYNWKKFWQLPQEKHDVSWFVLDWRPRNNIAVEFKVYRWKVFSRRWWSSGARAERWLRLFISPSGVLRYNYPPNAGVWFYTKEPMWERYNWIVQFPRVVSALFAPKEYDLIHLRLHIVNGMSRVGYFTAVYDIEYVAFQDPLDKPFCVLCFIMEIPAPYPSKPVLLRKPVYKISTLEYIKWGILKFPFVHNHEAAIDQAEQQAMNELQPQIDAYCEAAHTQNSAEVRY